MSMNKNVLFVFVSISIEVLIACQVQLPQGTIRGQRNVTINKKVFYSFEKIPYAAPPIGNLRFKPPQPPNNWNGVLDTKLLDVMCYQLNSNSDAETEDCLYLNVFTPKLPSKCNNRLLPVMVFLHGGGFVGGSAIGIRSDRLIEEDIIFVTLNYRLGPFGFLSTQDEVVPGNNGLKDQLFALQWVHENIELFGGNPQAVTLFGQSTGAGSVGYHLINQNAKGLFQGAILQSGSPISAMGYQRDSRNIAFKTAALLNETFLSNTNSNDLIDYFQKLEAKDLDAVSKQYHDLVTGPQYFELFQGFLWAPVLEVKNPTAFLTKKMYGLVQAGNTLGVPIVIGMCSEESVALNKDLFMVFLSAYDKNLTLLVPNDMQLEDENARLEMGQKIRDIYTSGKPLTENYANGIRFASDQSLTRNVLKFAELYSNYFKTYFYQFSYDGALGGTHDEFDGAEKVGHGADLRYLFCSGELCDLSKYSEEDKATTKKLIKLWTNFVKFRNPTPTIDELFDNVSWPLLSTKTGEYLYLNINKTIEVRNHPREETYSKWVELYNSLNFTDFDTY